MPSLHNQVSEQFRRWELRGRGWKVFDRPIAPEPPFEPFRGYCIPPVTDDAVRPTILSSLVSDLRRWLSEAPPVIENVALEPEIEPEPTSLVREDDLVELQATLPANLNIPREAFEAFLSNVSGCSEPVAFELVGSGEKIFIQFASHPDDFPHIRRQLMAYFPEATFVPTKGTLAPFAVENEYCAIVEFGLNREFLYPLASGKIDPSIGIIGALNELRSDDHALCQVLFQPCQNPWATAILDYTTDFRGGSLFVNQPEWAGLAQTKTSKPLYAVVLRIAAKSDSFESSWEILRNMAAALRVLSHPTGNELIPLHNSEYPFEAHLGDLIKRQSRRSGMLLNSDELVGLVRLPSGAVRSARLSRQRTNSKAAPSIVLQSSGLILGNNIHAGETRAVRLNPNQRTGHLHALGASGSGKSTFLYNLIRQDIESGEGLAVLDPHGDLIDKVLETIPENRIQDVVLIDPSDETASVGFNVLSAHSELEKTLLASDLVSVFQRLSQSWGDQMETVLRNAILAFLESSRGGTLADLRRFLLDAKFRGEFLKTVNDPDIRFFWQHGFAQLSGNKSIGPVLTRLETFLSPKPLRYIVAQRSNKLDFAHILDSGKILLAKLSQGAIGRENAYLLGSLLMAKFQQTAMSRQRQAASLRRDFWIYLDEFQNFITPSMAEILSGARKYRIGLTLAHQELRQLERDREVASAVLSNPYTRVVFRVSDGDARSLESGFSSFIARDLQNLATGEALVRVERSDFDFNISVPWPDEIDQKVAEKRRAEVTAASRRTYSIPRDTIEKELNEPLGPPPEIPAVAEPSPAPAQRSEPPSASLPAPVAPTQAVFEPSPLPASSGITKPHKAELKPPSELGRGGVQHKAIQKRLKTAAERLGYKATIEKEVLSGMGSVDLALESESSKIAVEITVTTTIDHEVGNIIKCLKSEFPLIVAVSSSEAKLAQLKAAISAAVGADDAARVLYFLPDTFIDYLKQISATTLPLSSPVPSKIRGYKVTRSVANKSPDEIRRQEEEAIKALAASMKAKRTKQ